MFEIDKNNIVETVSSLIEGEEDVIANCANTCAVLFNAMENVNWCGFYFFKEEMLVLGPFQGKPACIRINIDRGGVCATAVKERKTIIVDDVNLFDKHIACDSASQSEIVIPIIKEKIIYGVLDVDSPIKNRFGKQEQEMLEKVTLKLIQGCSWN